jgi:hypothetical protein
MLDNIITLPVDELHDATDVNCAYTRHEESVNRTVYISPDHSLVAPDLLTFYRTPVKQSGNFRGVAKTSAKFSQSILVDGVDATTSVSAPIIIDVGFSVPVGATPAQVLLARQRAVALLDLDAIMDELNNRQSV